MKTILPCLAFVAIVSAAPAHAQEVYGGVGFPGLYNVGYAHALGPKWGVRAQYGAGLNYSYSGNIEGVNADVTVKAASAGLFADWFPFGNGFRFIGGVTVNNIKAQMTAQGSGTATINGQSVNMSGEYYNMTVKFPDTMPYIGLGYGHHENSKGLGFYVDFGFQFGKPEVKSETSLVTNGKATQADIDAQDQKVRDSLSGVGYLPVLHLGMSYRF